MAKNINSWILELRIPFSNHHDNIKRVLFIPETMWITLSTPNELRVAHAEILTSFDMIEKLDPHSQVTPSLTSFSQAKFPSEREKRFTAAAGRSINRSQYASARQSGSFANISLSLSTGAAIKPVSVSTGGLPGRD